MDLPHKKNNNYGGAIKSSKQMVDELTSPDIRNYFDYPKFNNDNLFVSQNVTQNRNNLNFDIIKSDIRPNGSPSFGLPQDKMYFNDNQNKMQFTDKYINKSVISDQSALDINKSYQNFLHSKLLRSGNLDIQKSKDPISCLFSFIFKQLSIFSYLFLPQMLVNFGLAYQFMILFNALDFWTTKNITGRHLIGLRWWCEFNAEGDEQWMFETKLDQKNNLMNERFFWFSQCSYTLFNILMIVYEIFEIRLQMISCLIFALVQSGYNLYAFYLCSRMQKEKFKELHEGNSKKGDILEHNLNLLRGSMKLHFH